MWVGSCHLLTRFPFVHAHRSVATGPRDCDVRAEQHYERDHRVDVPEAVGDSDEQLYLVVQRLNPGVADVIADCGLKR